MNNVATSLCHDQFFVLPARTDPAGVFLVAIDALPCTPAPATFFRFSLVLLHLFKPWRSSTFPTAIDGPSDALGEISHVHFTPFRSLATGAGAGLTRAVSRTFTFPLDTLKTRGQVSRMREEDRAAMPEVGLFCWRARARVYVFLRVCVCVFVRVVCFVLRVLCFVFRVLGSAQLSVVFQPGSINRYPVC